MQAICTWPAHSWDILPLHGLRLHHAVDRQDAEHDAGRWRVSRGCFWWSVHGARRGCLCLGGGDGGAEGADGANAAQDTVRSRHGTLERVWGSPLPMLPNAAIHCCTSQVTRQPGAGAPRDGRREARRSTAQRAGAARRPAANDERLWAPAAKCCDRVLRLYDAVAVDVIVRRDVSG